MKPRLRSTSILVGLTLIAVAACSGDDDISSPTTAVATTAAPTTTRPATTTSTSTTSTSTSTSSTTTTTTTPPPVIIPRQPLTGQPLAPGETVVPRPALAVKIDNHSGARRNHSGLAVADIVFEEIVEGGLTRFAAVFHTQGSDPVGPIRSGRSQDIDLLTSFNRPLFAWSGGNAGVTRLIRDSVLTDLNVQRGGRGYYRGPGSKPHNLYNSTDRLWEQVPFGHPGAPPQQFTYVLPDEEFPGRPVDGADMQLGHINVSWRWDPEAKAFLRSQEGGPHRDAVHGRIGATNVLVLAVDYQPSAIDARSPEAQTTNNGPLWVLSDGELVEGRWFRPDASGPLQLLGAGNEPIALTPGNTWVELVKAIVVDDLNNPEADVDIVERE